MILVLVEHDGGSVDRSSLEAVTLGRRLAAGLGLPLHVAVFGLGASDAAARLGLHGVDTIHAIDHPRLTDYAPAALGMALVQLAGSLAPTAVLGAATDRGSEVMAHLAARTGQALAANCIDIRPGVGDDAWQVTRQRWGGSLLEDAVLHGRPYLLTVAPHAVAAEEAPVRARGTVASFRPEITDRDLAVRVMRRVAPDTSRVSLTDARVVVGGGRGVGGADGFAALDELAALLGGTVGVSRAVTSAGWRPHAEQVGQTGVRIAPELYIACGISGAIQHMVGARTAKRILAINTDPNAPMVVQATYAVIGDLRTVVPAIVAEIRRSQAT
ncbi:MAG: electron transfer flavoprotein subunit alpha/FixB family protein [Candidatus Limnocylindrales bacterium]